MSVIVKNMEMPDRCGRCKFVRWSNLHQTAWCTLAQEACFENFSKDYKNRRADFCPLVELPPHGNLKDESDIISLIEVMFCKDKDGMEHAIQCVKDAFTVIEAEGSEE